MSAEELALAERDAFLTWRRQLVSMEDEQLILMTPFEKNIEVWKQLWRVIDRCSVVATIVDGRNPLLYRSQDMEAYVKELGAGAKVNVIIINKADYLSVEQRRLWVKWFDREGLRVVFWSAARSMQREEEKERKMKERERRRREREARKERGLVLGMQKAKLEDAISDDDEEDEEDEEEEPEEDEQKDDSEIDEKKDAASSEHKPKAVESEQRENKEEEVSDKTSARTGASVIDAEQNSTDILTRDELLDYFRHAYHSIHPASPVPSSAASTASPSRIQIAFVGFPNVGNNTATPNPAHISIADCRGSLLIELCFSMWFQQAKAVRLTL